MSTVLNYAELRIGDRVTVPHWSPGARRIRGKVVGRMVCRSQQFVEERHRRDGLRLILVQCAGEDRDVASWYQPEELRRPAR